MNNRPLNARDSDSPAICVFRTIKNKGGDNMEEMLNALSVPALAAVVYWIVNLIKHTANNDERLLTFVPLISTALGVICGVVCYFVFPSVIHAENLLNAVIIGGASGLTATGFNQIIKQQQKGKK